MELTGTNRSNPLDPNAVPRAGKARTTVRVQRQAPTHPTRRSQQDTSPRAFANPAFRTPRNPPVFQEGPWAPGSTHRSSRWAEGPRGLPSTKSGAPKAHRGLREVCGPPDQVRGAPFDQDRRAKGAPGSQGGLASLVATARGKTPDPIPNSAVKTLSADGTAAQAAEEQVAARLAKPPQPHTLPKPGVPGQTAPRPPDPVRERSGGPHAKPTTAGWSSPVARQAHNLKVTGSNPVPATNPQAQPSPSTDHPLKPRRTASGKPLRALRFFREVLIRANPGPGSICQGDARVPAG